MREVCGGDGSSCTFNSNTFVKRLTQFGEFTHKFEAKSQSCVVHRQGCNAVDTWCTGLMWTPSVLCASQ